MKPISPNPIPLQQPSQLVPKSTAKPGDQAKLENAAEEFESMLVLQMLRTMQSTLEGGSMFGSSNTNQIYGGLGEMQLAKTIAEANDFGVKDQLLDYIRKLETQAHEPQSK